MNRFTLFITLLLATLGVGLPLSAQTYTTEIQTSTPESPIFYSICNYRAIVANGSKPTYLASTYSLGNGQRTAAKSPLTYWIFEDASSDVPSGTTVPEGVKPVYLYSPFTEVYLIYGAYTNKEASLFLTHDETRKQIWYLVPNGNTVASTSGAGNGFGISTTPPSTHNDDFTTVTFSGNYVLIDANQSKSIIGRWNANNTRNEGNTWFFTKETLSEEQIATNKQESLDNILEPVFPSNVSGLWTDEQYNTYTSALEAAKTKDQTKIADAYAAEIALYANLNGTYKRFYQNNTQNVGRGDRSISVNSDGNGLEAPLTSDADCNTIFTIEIIEGTTTFRVKTYEDKYVAPIKTADNQNTDVVSSVESAGVFALTPWMNGTNLIGIGIYNVDAPNRYFHMSNTNPRKIFGWEAPSGANNASGWLVADMSSTMAEIEAKKAGALNSVNNTLEAWNLFPTGTFGAEAIEAVNTAKAAYVPTIPGSTLLSAIPTYTFDISSVTTPLATAAATAEGKVVAFKSNADGSNAYFAAGDADGSTLTRSTTLTPACAWILNNVENSVNFKLKSLTSGLFLADKGGNLGQNTSAVMGESAETVSFTANSGKLNINIDGITVDNNNNKFHLHDGNTTGIVYWGPDAPGSKWDAEAIVLPESVTVSPESLALVVAGESPLVSGEVTATVSPDNVTPGFDAVEWASSNASYATVAANFDAPLTATVTPEAAGNGTITATLKYTTATPAPSASANFTVEALQLILCNDEQAIKVMPAATQGEYMDTVVTIPFILKPNVTLTEEQISKAKITIKALDAEEGATPCIKAAAENPVVQKTGTEVNQSNIELHLIATAPGKASVSLEIAGVTCATEPVEGDPVTACTVTVTAVSTTVASIGVESAKVEGVNEEDVCVLGTQTGENAWAPTDVKYVMDVTLAPKSAPLYASDVTVTTESKALSDLAFELSEPKKSAEGDVYTLTITAKATAQAENATISITAPGMESAEEISFAIVAPEVKIASIAVEADGLTDGKITLGNMTAFSEANGATYAASAAMTPTATVTLDAVSSWPTAADLTAAISTDNSAGLSTTVAIGEFTRNDNGTFSVALGDVTASKPGTSTVTVSQNLGDDAPEGTEAVSGSVTITGVAPVVAVKDVTAPAAQTVSLTKTADGTIGDSAEQTAVFTVTTDRPTNALPADVRLATNPTTGITPQTPVAALAEGSKNGVGTEFTVTVKYVVSKDAPASGQILLNAGTGKEATMAITVVTPVVGITASMSETTLVLDEGKASATITGSISPEAAGFTAEQISATATTPEGTAAEGFTFGTVTKTTTGNGFTIPVTATKAGYYKVTVSYTKGSEVISATPIEVIVTEAAPEEGIKLEEPIESEDTAIAVEIKQTKDEAPVVNIAFNDNSASHEIDLPFSNMVGVDLNTFYMIEYDTNNNNGSVIKADLKVNAKGTPVLALSNAKGATAPYQTVIKVVEKGTVNRAAGDAAIVVNASINSAKIESVTITNGSSMRVYLNQAITLDAAIDPAGTGNNVTFTVTDSQDNVVQPVSVGGNEYRFSSTGTYTVTATVDGTVPAVTTTATIHVVAGVTGIEQINADAAEGRAEIYDLSGRRVRRIDAAGIYIINGQKTFVR